MKNLRRVVIIGFMGSGKTEVARALARRLRVEMIDLDEFITSQTGQTPARLIEQEGEAAFRKIEFEALTKVLKDITAAVVSLGGGAWIQSKNRDILLADGSVIVWLDTPFDLCWSRIESTPSERPLGRTREHAHKLYQSRLPLYQLAKIQIQPGSNDTPDEIAAKIEADVSGPLCD